MSELFESLYKFFGLILTRAYDVIPDFAWAIAILTIVSRLIVLPLSIKQIKSTRAMQQLAPQLKQLQTEYKNDRQKLNEEMMKLYKDNGVNPLAGCLPLLVQMPLLIAVYHAVRGMTSIPPKYVTEGSAIFKDLVSSNGEMRTLGMDFAKRASEVGGSIGKALPYWLLIVAVVATGFYQQRQIMKNSSNQAQQANPQMQMVTKVMPFLFGLFAINFPAAIAFYILIGQIFQIGQQAIIMKRMPPPVSSRAVVDVKESSKSKDVSKASRNGTSATNKPEVRSNSGRVTPKKKG